MHAFPRTLAAVLAAVLFITGCNVLDAAYEEGTGSVDELLGDAQIARQNNDYEQAIRLIQRAYEQAPANPVVRLDYAATLMQRDRLNLIDIEQIADHLMQEVEEQGSGNRFAGADSCTFSDDRPAEPFNPYEAENYDEVIAARPTLAQIVELLNGSEGAPEPPVMPQSLQNIDLCTALEAGEINYDRAALLAELRTIFDGNDERVNEALWSNAVALTLHAYLGIFESAEVPVSWFIVRPDAGSYVGFCVAEEHVQPMKDNIQAYLHDVGEALISLDLLIHNSVKDTSEMDEYLQEVLEMYQTYEEGLGEFCTGA